MGITGRNEIFVFEGFFLIFLRIAENIAETCNVTRQDQDVFALQSQAKCEEAISLGHFDTEIEPIIISSAKSIREHAELP